MDHKTQLLDGYKKEDIQIAANLLKDAQVVAIPTETVYGLAADAKNPQAVEKIFIAKNRPVYHPLIVHIDSFEKINEWAQDVSPLAKIIADHFWPGPITLIFKKAVHVSSVVTGGLDSIALRVPQHTVFLELLKMLDTGLAAPSANAHKAISPTTAQHVLRSLSGKIAAVVDAGPCSVGIESTILDLTDVTPTIVRQGPITQAMLENILKKEVKIAQDVNYRVAGNMKEHYQPNTPAYLMTIQEIQHTILAPENKYKKFGIMYHSAFSGLRSNDEKNLVFYAMPSDKHEYARMMYTTLHELDVLNLDQILIEQPVQREGWGDVWDRLLKATAQRQAE